MVRRDFMMSESDWKELTKIAAAESKETGGPVSVANLLRRAVRDYIMSRKEPKKQ